MLHTVFNSTKFVHLGGDFQPVTLHVTDQIRPEYQLDSYATTTVYNTPDIDDVFSGTVLDLDKLISVVNGKVPAAAYVRPDDSVVLVRNIHSTVTTDDYVDFKEVGAPIWYYKNDVIPLNEINMLKVMARKLGDDILVSKRRLLHANARAVEAFNNEPADLVSFSLALNEEVKRRLKDAEVVKVRHDGRLVHSEPEVNLAWVKGLGLTNQFQTATVLNCPDGLYQVKDGNITSIKDSTGMLLRTADGGYTQLSRNVALTRTGFQFVGVSGRYFPVDDMVSKITETFCISSTNGVKIYVIPERLVTRTFVFQSR